MSSKKGLKFTIEALEDEIEDLEGEVIDKQRQIVDLLRENDRLTLKYEPYKTPRKWKIPGTDKAGSLSFDFWPPSDWFRLKLDRWTPGMYFQITVGPLRFDFYQS